MAKVAKKTEPELIELKPITKRQITIRIIGDSPLIVHAWSAKAKKEMLDKQMKKAKGPKVAKDPQRDFEEAFYRMEDGTPGFPSIGIKAAAVSAAGRFADGMKMTEVKGSFHILGELVSVEGEANMREDMVRIGMGTADIRYRPEFKEWAIDLPILYNPDAISAEQIINILNLAGFGVGIGEWRVEKDGRYGMFHVDTGKGSK